jgi:CheY-like chemotaxis protein
METYSVLVVDDNVDAADTLAVMLSVSGWETRVAYSGQEALDAVLDRRPLVVLVDIGMPGMSGLSVATRLREVHKECCPILVALTAWSDDATKVSCAEAGFAAHLTKPTEMDALLATLRQLVSAPRLPANCPG